MSSSLLTAWSRTTTVANESVAGARQLQQDRWDQQQAEKHVNVKEGPDPEDRYAQGDEENQEEYPSRGG